MLFDSLRSGDRRSPGLGGWILGWFFLVSVLKKSGGGSSPRSILHSKAYKHWMYCFLSELAALLDVPTFRLVASSLHFLFLFTWWATERRRFTEMHTTRDDLHIGSGSDARPT